MLIYLAGFALSTALIALGEKKKTKHFVLLSVFALLIPCLIAALRAPYVGTDTTVYLKPLSHSAITADNLWEFFKTYWWYSYKNVYVEGYEIGFSLLVYLAGKSTASMVAVQFAVAAAIIVPIYITLARYRKQIPIWLGMLMFYLFFFNSTLNMMRQWMAMSFLLLAFQFMLEKKWGGTVAMSIIATLFHMSSVLGFAVFAVYWLLYLVRSKQVALGRFVISGKLFTAFLLFAVSFLVLMNLDLVLKVMELVGFTRFSNYLQGNAMRILPMQFVVRLPLIALFAIHWKHFSRTTPLAAFFISMLLLDTAAAQLISVDVYSFRIGYYFTVYLILGVPMLIKSIPCPTKRRISVLVLIGYLLFYWYYNYVMQMRHETVPYEFINLIP